MVTASVTGVFRTVLILIGVFVLLRFVGQLMNAKRAQDEERKLNDQQKRFDQEKLKSSKNKGKTKVLGESDSSGAEDVDFEEVE